MANLRDLQEQAEALFRDLLQRRKITFNGNYYETQLDILTRHNRATIQHLNSLEERYAELENRFNMHSQGVTHRPTRKLPKADESS
jgi:hypothetical protein